MPAVGPRRTAIACTVLLLLLAGLVTLAVGTGSVAIAPGEVWASLRDHLTGRSPQGADDAIIWEIRLPRVLLAAVVGAGLTTAGTVVQVMVRNALADPFLLGVSSGASVGATAVMLFGTLSSLGLWALSGGAIAGALGAMLLVFVVAQRDGRVAPTQLVLTGVVLSSMFSAIASFLLFRANPQATQSVLFWMLGSFGSATWDHLGLPTVVLVIGLVLLLAQSRALNALAAGPQIAASVGVDVHRLRRRLFVITSVIAGACVAVSGVIGFIGLVGPHVVRLLVGSDHRRVLPVGILLGACFAVLGDLLARVLVAPQEMPMGVITAFVGAPVLLALLRRRSGYAGEE